MVKKIRFFAFFQIKKKRFSTGWRTKNRTIKKDFQFFEEFFNFFQAPGILSGNFFKSSAVAGLKPVWTQNGVFSWLQRRKMP